MSKSVAMVCINDLCNRREITSISGAARCTECGGDMFPVEPSPMVQQMLLEAEEKYGRVGYPELRTVRPSDVFSCPEDLTGCPVAERPQFLIPLDLYNKWIFLANQIDTEWIAYLLGKQIGEKLMADRLPKQRYKITGMYFPRQVATSTHVETEEGEIRPGTIGAVHSHVGMRAFFSGEDLQHANHPVEIVVNRMGEMEARGRSKLECGRMHRGEADVIFVDCERELSLENELNEKLRVDERRMQVTNGKVDAR